MSLLDQITPGTRVTIAVPGGIGRGGVEYTRRTGRAVMRGPHGWVLNLGGTHGTPGVATEDNIIKIGRRARRNNPELMVVYNPMPEVPRRLRGKLSVPEQHQLRIARQTLRYSDAGARIMGGMTKDEARALLRRHGLKSNPKLTPFGPGGKGVVNTYPRWSVMGRTFADSATARAFAQMKADESGKENYIMQKDDPYLPAFMSDKIYPEGSVGDLTQKYGHTALNPRGSSMHWGRHLGQMGEYKPVSKKTHAAYIAWLTRNAEPGEEVPTFDKVSRGKYSIRADRLEEFKKRGHLERRGNPRRGRMTVTYKETKTMARRGRRRRNPWYGDSAGHSRAAKKGWRRRRRGGRKRRSSKRKHRARRRKGTRRHKGGRRRRKARGTRVRYRGKLYTRAALGKKIGKRKAAATFSRRKGKKKSRRRRKSR